MKKTYHLAVGLAAAAALLTACAGTPGKGAQAAFTPGKFRNGDTVAIFNPDGTFVGTTAQGADWVKGTYVVNGNEVTFEDTWEATALTERMGKSCLGIKGRYSWTLVGDVMTATAIDDPCEGRNRGTSGIPWTRMR